MKLSITAFSAIFIGLGNAEAKTLSNAAIQDRMKKGEINKRSLLRNATPYGEATKRKLLDRQLAQDDVEITGYHSIHLNSCLGLSVENEELLQNYMIEYAEKGIVESKMSFVTFTVCETGDCSNQEENELTFVTDVASFMSALTEHEGDQAEEYCQACAENQSYCKGGSNQRLLLDDTGRRRLADGETVVEYIDCKKCKAYNCYGDGDAGNYEYEDALGWLNDMTGCVQAGNGQQWNGMNVYGGLVCSEGGAKVQLGVFLDEDCTLLASGMNYKDYMSGEEKAYYSMTTNLLENVFASDFNCLEQEVTYVNSNYVAEEGEEEAEAQGQQQGNGNAPEAIEFCQNMFDGDFKARSLYDCVEDDNNGQQQQAAQEDAAANTYDWYTFDLTEEEIDDEEAICLVIQGMEGAYETAYDTISSGGLISLKTKESLKKKIGPIIIGVVVATLLAVLAGYAYKLYRSYQEDDTKKDPLLEDEPAEGSIAETDLSSPAEGSTTEADAPMPVEEPMPKPDSSLPEEGLTTETESTP